ncbi:MAG: thioredoxin family protein [Bacteroidetes bacterium]|nr:thioredoxin family protein [Bacteroidota bacterium]
MKKYSFILIFGVFILSLAVKSEAQQKSANASIWFDSFEKTLSVAKEKKLSVLLFFTGTDTCTNCIKMRENIINSQAFTEYSKQSFVMMAVDYPNAKANKLSPGRIKKNKELVRKYNPSGKVPQIVVLDVNGSVKATANYVDIPVSEYLPQFKALLDVFK